MVRPHLPAVPHSVPLLICLPFLQVFFWQGIFLILAQPEDCYDPPALPVIHQLNTIDAALERFTVFGSMPGLIGAEDVSNLAEQLRLASNFRFKKTILLKNRICSLDVLLHGEGSRSITAVGS